MPRSILCLSMLSLLLAACVAASARANETDDAFRAITAREWTWRNAEFAGGEDEDGEGAPSRRLPSIDPATYQARLKVWDGVLALPVPAVYCVETKPFLPPQVTGSQPPLEPPRADTVAPSRSTVMTGKLVPAPVRQLRPPPPVPEIFTVPVDGVLVLPPPLVLPEATFR